MERYNRQLILPGFGITAQQKLTDAKVLVVGAGGLGCPVLQYLCAAGVGELGVVDPDTVSLSNLQRQVLYDEQDIGDLKVTIVQKKLAILNSDTTIRIYPCRLCIDTVFELVDSYSIIVDCTDNFTTRYLLNDVCQLLQKPLVYAALFRFEGQLSVFHYGENPSNLRDLFPEIPNPLYVPSCNEAGVIGVLTGIMGNFQANEVLKIITGIGEVMSGQLLTFNSLDYQSELLRFKSKTTVFKPKNKADILNQSYEYSCKTIAHINDLETLKNVFNRKKTVLIDVRNTDELPKIVGFNVMAIPLSELEQHLEQLADSETLVFTCQSGIRSLKAIALVQKQYPDKNYYNLKNGIALFTK
ncbi:MULTISPECIES: HesA/MoeB/ThiF family protein [unclassified Flavobacterium]|uniref:HesA/MoeB/ThiF family protein n=1 Tax=unclassified Flavobacterium TaxID=196869 RepID=UPI0026058763|nr:HesA/MoeB/ThiF family protein [Flavobacterium sp.]